MDKVIVIIVGAICGVGQFLLMRHSLKPLTEGGSPKIGLFMILKFLIPLALLVGCALVDPKLLPYAGGALCLMLFITTGINYLLTLKKKG